jgi:hypothetical protein
MPPARNATSGTILARAFDLLSRSLSEVRFFVLPGFIDGSDRDRAAAEGRIEAAGAALRSTRLETHRLRRRRAAPAARR